MVGHRAGDRCGRRSAGRRCAGRHATGRRSVAVLRNEGRAQVGIGSAIGATGMLIALAAIDHGHWALPVFVVPLLLTQFSFRRYAAIRAT